MKAAVLGFPIEHSLSPLLHREIFRLLDIDGDYSRISVQSGELLAWFDKNADEYDYLSLTMPLKEEALSLDVSIDPVLARIQSANTLYRRDDAWHLTSTDGSGFISALRHQGIEKVASTLVLGAGGTARALVGALDGISDSITVMGRTSTRRDSLEQSVTSSKFEYIRWEESIDFARFDLVVNTTPAGAADLLASSVRPSISATLFDVIYKPWPTVLASRWSDAGAVVINGLELLIYQGIQQCALATGQVLDEEKFASHLRPILRAAAR
jgi:shikimate dehydrogenase